MLPLLVRRLPQRVQHFLDQWNVQDLHICGNARAHRDRQAGTLLAQWHVFPNQVSCIEIIIFFIEVAVSNGFASPSDNPLIGPDTCAILKMQGRLTSAIVNHNQVRETAIARAGTPRTRDLGQTGRGRAPMLWKWPSSGQTAE